MAKVLQKPTTGLFPVPVVMVSCCDEKGESPNIITIAWVGTLCSDPPLVGISVRPQRHSHGLIARSGEFVINIPSEGQVWALDYCGLRSGREEDKFTGAGLTPEKGSIVKAPLIKECPVALECQVRQTINLGTHDLFIGEVVAIQVEEEILDVKGKIDFERAKPVAYNGKEYWNFQGPVGARGIALGR
ncbi:MAG: flavin reductase family protein [Limnochordia bacterium]|jgi:flavin reductase (DIM6/NTAB) family NADH-FMN oxidoreductase RutF